MTPNEINQVRSELSTEEEINSNSPKSDDEDEEWFDAKD
jgi:hypothetical protein